MKGILFLAIITFCFLAEARAPSLGSRIASAVKSKIHQARKTIYLKMSGADEPTARLTQAIAKNNYELAQQALIDGAKIDAPVMGITPLGFATQRGNDGMVNFIILSGADVNIRFSLMKFTALHVASGKNRMWIAKRLLESGANPRAVDGQNKTPSDWAKTSEMIELLSKYEMKQL